MKPKIKASHALGRLIWVCSAAGTNPGWGESISDAYNAWLCCLKPVDLVEAFLTLVPLKESK